MNQIVATKGIEIVEKINWKKIFIFLAIFSVLYYLYRYIKNQKEIADLKQDARQINAITEVTLEKEKLMTSHTAEWYRNSAEMIHGYLTQSFWNGGGWYGCNQEGIYDIFDQIKYQEDWALLVKAYDVRDVRGSWWYSSKPMNLVQSIQECMQDDEIKEIRSKLANAGIHVF